MKVLKVEIDNFLSIEKASVAFDDAGLLLIEGYNYDVDRANGAGKTAVLNALSFGLYDKLPRKITATEVLRRGAKKGCVSVWVDVGSKILVVRRSRPKGVNFFEVEDSGSERSLAITQEEWEDMLRLTYNQFIVSMYCSQSNSAVSPRFLLLNDADKKQFLLQLLDLEEFALCKKKTDEKLTQLLAEANQVQNNINLIQTKIDAFSESVIDERHVEFEIGEYTMRRAELVRLLNERASIPKPDLAKFQKLDEDIQTKRTEFTRIRARREMLKTQWDRLGRELVPFNAKKSCTMCGSQLDSSHAEGVHNTRMQEVKGERLTIKNEIDSIDASLMKENQINELASKIKEKKRQESADYEQANLARVEISAKMNSIDSLLQDLDNKLKNNAVQVAKIKALREKQGLLKQQADTLAKEMEIQKTVATIYSPTGAQAYILDSAVALFNEHISKYINILWSNLTYELQTSKENVKGDITAKFSESIVMDGKPISLGSLSGGELKALSICTDMALLGLLEQQFGIHMSPVIFDEAFDGLDASGKEFALELIKSLAQDRQVVVIDHASEMRAAFDKVLRVEKRNGISSVNLLA